MSAKINTPVNFIYSVKRKELKFEYQLDIRLFVIKDNKPDYLTNIEIKTGGYKGTETVITQWLVDNKHLPENCIDADGYWDVYKVGEVFTLTQI